MFNQWRMLYKLNRNIRLLLGVWALSAFAYFGIMGVLLNLYLLRLGLGPEFIGLLIASGQLIWALVALPAGGIGQRFGLRSALIFGDVLITIGVGALLMVELLPESMWATWLFASWSLLWVGSALFTVNSIPYLMHASAAEERTLAFSAQAAMLAIWAFVGSIVAGLLPGIFASWLGLSLDNPEPYWYTLWLAPLAFALCIFLWTRADSVRLLGHEEVLATATKPWGLFIFFGLVVFLTALAEGSVRAFFNVYLDKELVVPTVQIGTIYGIGQLIPLVAILAAPLLLNRWGTAQALFWTSMGIGLAFLPLAFVPSWFAAAVGFIGILSFVSLNGVARNIFSQEIVSPRWQTTTSAIGTIGLALGWSTAAAIGGYLIADLGFGSLFFLSAIMALMAAVLMFGYVRSVDKRVTTTSQVEVLDSQDEST